MLRASMEKTEKKSSKNQSAEMKLSLFKSLQNELKSFSNTATKV